MRLFINSLQYFDPSAISDAAQKEGYPDVVLLIEEKLSVSFQPDAEGEDDKLDRTLNTEYKELVGVHCGSLFVRSFLLMISFEMMISIASNHCFRSLRYIYCDVGAWSS